MRAYARLIRKFDSSGTGRPVAPFAPPDFHAVPAMSRWAQVYLRVKFSRKAAAVHEAPPGEPMLARSAKLDLSCSLYSSPIGRRHAASPAVWPAAISSAASALWAA